MHSEEINSSNINQPINATAATLSVKSSPPIANSPKFFRKLISMVPGVGASSCVNSDCKEKCILFLKNLIEFEFLKLFSLFFTIAIVASNVIQANRIMGSGFSCKRVVWLNI